MSKIARTKALTPRHTEYVIQARDIARDAGPGQLVMMRFEAEERPSPHAIADIDRTKGRITVVVDRGSEARADRSPMALAEITGPLGRIGRTRSGGKVLFAAQGLGVAAMLPRIREHKQEGCYTIAIAGFPSKDLVFWEDRIEPYCDELYVTTEDGSYGIKGPVKHTIRAVCENNNDIEQAVVLGPIATLRSAAEMTRRYEIPTIVNLNAVMDGDVRANVTGQAGEEHVPEGRDFDWSAAADLDGHGVDFDEVARQLGIQPVQ